MSPSISVFLLFVSEFTLRTHSQLRPHHIYSRRQSTRLFHLTTTPRRHLRTTMAQTPSDSGLASDAAAHTLARGKACFRYRKRKMVRAPKSILAELTDSYIFLRPLSIHRACACAPARPHRLPILRASRPACMPARRDVTAQNPPARSAPARTRAMPVHTTTGVARHAPRHFTRRSRVSRRRSLSCATQQVTCPPSFSTGKSMLTTGLVYASLCLTVLLSWAYGVNSSA